MSSNPRPTGAVTFLVTDIEQSTRRWEEQPDAMREDLALHDIVLREAIERNGGWLFKHTGDGVLAAFSVPRAAIDAAIAAQRKLEVPVRMGICTGEVEARNHDYYGPPLNRAARVMAAGHGGQILVSEATAATVAGADLLDLGEHRLRDLSRPQRLYQIRAEGLKQTFPPLRSLNAALGNLPAQATSFLGRETEVKDVAALLQSSRLVTLTGVGGVGKTRLAIQTAAETSTGAFPDGAWLVELAAVRDPASVRHVLAAAIGATPGQGRTIEEGLAASLAARRLLLILDNCEHLIDAVASLARLIIARCPQATILATSREALMIDGERIFPVPSLAFREGAASPAVELFVDRARAIAADFDSARDEIPAREICRRLDGIPLAIELAAARARTMSPAQIRDNLNSRFRLLTGGMRGAVERHQTLRHAVQWSYDLLSPAEQTLLARASVFAGGFTREAAENMCAVGTAESFETIDLLNSLVRKSLVTVERSGVVMRYGLLETIRQFGDERLAEMGEADSARLRHAQLFADDSDAHFEKWRSPRQPEAHEWLDREMDNLRSAFAWAKDAGHVDIAVRIASNVGDMARFRLRDEAANWPEEILEAARATRHRRLPILLTWAASAAWSFGELQKGQRFGEEAIALIGKPEFEPFVWAFTDLALIALMSGDPGRAVELARSGAEQEADRRDRMCLVTVPLVLTLAGRATEARTISDDVVAAAEATGVPSSIALAWMAKAEALAEADYAQSLSAYEHAAASARRSGARLFLTMIVPKLAATLMRLGDKRAALLGFREMLESSGGSADLAFVSRALGNLIVLFEQLGELSTAAALNGALSRMAGSSALVPELPDTVSRLRAHLGEEAYEAAARRGASMAARETNDFALAQIARALTVES